MPDKLNSALQAFEDITPEQLLKIKQALVEAVTSNFSSFFGALSRLPNPFKDLNKLDIYKEFENAEKFDERIGDALVKRKALTLSKGWTIEPADESAQAQAHAEYINYCFDQINMRGFLSEALNAVYYGFQVCELIWSQNKNGWYPSKFKFIKPKYLSFDENGNEYISLSSWQGKDLESPLTVPLQKVVPFKFLRFTPDERFSDPQGMAVAGRVYWPWIFKKQDFVFWMKLGERFGIPTRYATVDGSGMDEDALTARLDAVNVALQKLLYDSTAAFPTGTEVSMLETQNTGEFFVRLLDACNKAIDIAILGTPLLTDAGTVGSLALGEVHSELLTERSKTDAKCLEETINRFLIQWIIDINFGPQEIYPRFRIPYPDVASWETVRDAIDRGIAVSKKGIYANYNIPEPVDETDVFLKAEGGPSDLDLNSFTAGAEGEPHRPFFFSRLRPSRTEKPSK